MRVFYSRNIDKAEKLEEFCVKNNIQLIAEPLIRFEAVDFERPAGNHDVIFFTSPRSVDFFLQRLNVPMEAQIACIGESTKIHLEKQGFHVEFFGQNSSEPEQVAQDFLKWLGSRKVLFPISDQSNRSVQSVLNDNQYTEVVVYRTIETPKLLDTKFEFLIFSSPSNARSFLANHEILSTQIVACFGRTTHNYLLSQGVYSIILDSPTEDAVIHFLENQIHS